MARIVDVQGDLAGSLKVSSGLIQISLVVIGQPQRIEGHRFGRPVPGSPRQFDGLHKIAVGVIEVAQHKRTIAQIDQDG